MRWTVQKHHGKVGRVTLDGRTISTAIFADDVEGIVQYYKEDEAGHLEVNEHGAPIVETARGCVQVWAKPPNQNDRQVTGHHRRD